MPCPQNACRPMLVEQPPKARARALIWFDPQDCTRYLLQQGRRNSGAVLDGDWDLAAQPLTESPKFRFCVDHWQNGTPWEATGAYEHMWRLVEAAAARGHAPDGCRTMDDIVARYRRLDDLYEAVKAEGRLKTAFELGLSSSHRKEPGGILIHLDRHGRPLFGGAGHHRFAIAYVLGHRRAPAQLGITHAAFVASRPLRSASERWRRE